MDTVLHKEGAGEGIREPGLSMVSANCPQLSIVSPEFLGGIMTTNQRLAGSNGIDPEFGVGSGYGSARARSQGSVQIARIRYRVPRIHVPEFSRIQRLIAAGFSERMWLTD